MVLIEVRSGLKIATMFVLALFSASLIVMIPSSASSNTTGFQIINANWGTSSNSTSSAPGDSSIPLTLTLEYTFPNTATSVEGLLNLPSGFTVYNGSSTDYSALSQTMPTGTMFTMTFYSIYLASNLSLGAYTFELNLSWAAAGYSYILNQSSTFVLSVQGTPKISFEPGSYSLIPGEVNNVSLTIENSGTGAASSISITASSQYAGILNPIPEVNVLVSESSATYVIEVYLPKSSTGLVIPMTIFASYKDPYGNSKSTTQTLDFYGSDINGPSIAYSVEQHTLVPGEVNNITVTLTNNGGEAASNIVTSVSGSSQSISLVSDFPRVESLYPGSSYTAVLSVFVSDAAASSPSSLLFSTSYLDAYGNPETASQTEGFQVESVSSTNTSLSVSTLSNSITSGSINKVSFLVTNTGNTTIVAPKYSIAVSSPLVVSGNSSYSAVGTSIAAGKSAVFEASLTASPGSSSGIYPATLGVSFTDQYGTFYNESYSVAIILSGSVELVIQNEAFTQNATGITVTGSILNEGSASAYYAVVTGALNLSAAGAPNYVGEIDANSPVPFTVSIPYQAQTSSSIGNVTILIQYKNSLGQVLNSSASSTTRLESTSEVLPSNQGPAPGGSSSDGGLQLSLLERAIIVTIMLVAIGTAVVAALRRKQYRKRPVATARGKGQVA